jgi:hypothetical protein
MCYGVVIRSLVLVNVCYDLSHHLAGSAKGLGDPPKRNGIGSELERGNKNQAGLTRRPSGRRRAARRDGNSFHGDLAPAPD